MDTSLIPYQVSLGFKLFDLKLCFLSKSEKKNPHHSKEVFASLGI